MWLVPAADTSCDILQLKFPNAQILRTKVMPPAAVREGEDEVIWATCVVSEPDWALPVFAEGVNENLKTWHSNNRVKRFSSSRPYVVNTENNDGPETWLEKTVITSE